ncbi:hypothetical protein BJ138DRAFT_1175028 [Hygrophoropsis aurantiaca]|uniref:Uncharacterized protein n=1 Tax=Hygrophoropsis aurantiaca TaxID=72124 RepID=A0ACB7ZYP4_9AGAM|nr:hypothetical protein BJ138DRAFT_1175028 [Hygrophoropsis aurantiaca]
MSLPSLDDLVDEWLRLDKNENTRVEIQKLRNADDTRELEMRMRVRIQFGTAGLRGKMEAGWSRMNDLVIIQASQGLCAYVLENIKNAACRGVVVGHDHRYNSERWAQLTAAAFIASNVKVYLHRGLVHTPLVPFSVKQLDAACGVMITASHNPKQDNGYKVYWENAVQIIGPHDKGIAGAITENLVPRTWDISQLHQNGLCIDCTQDMKDAYFNSLLHLNFSSPRQTTAKFVNTSMHGVSNAFAVQAFEISGFNQFIPVEEQKHPDPDFPTVNFPNPEEKGALDLAIKTAGNEMATHVLAQDPDADRFSAAEKNYDGTWFLFTGDQLGALFAYYVLETYRTAGKPLDKLAMVASTVSSKMIEAMAQAEGFTFVECLTGFKFIGNTALDLARAGYEVPFGYEEAIGFMFGSEIRDKDGIAATLVFAKLVATLRERGLSVKDQLEQLYQKYGYFETRNSYFICSDPVTIDKIFSELRAFSSDSNYPESIANLSITGVVDLTVGHGYDSTNHPSFEPKLPLSSGHMIQFRAQSRISDGPKIALTIRTSGTEPKIKYYLEGNGKNRDEVHRLLPRVVEDLKGRWMKASANNLGSP